MDFSIPDLQDAVWACAGSPVKITVRRAAADSPFEVTLVRTPRAPVEETTQTSGGSQPTLAGDEGKRGDSEKPAAERLPRTRASKLGAVAQGHGGGTTMSPKKDLKTLPQPASAKPKAHGAAARATSSVDDLPVLPTSAFDHMRALAVESEGDRETAAALRAGCARARAPSDRPVVPAGPGLG